MTKTSFFNRDISWLSFNERVLAEAAKESVPLLERIRFLSIYSSNLDEFYRVRMPALMALHKLYEKDTVDKDDKKQFPDVVSEVKYIIENQLMQFGQILSQQILPALHQESIHLLYNEPLPLFLKNRISEFFFSEILAFIKLTPLAPGGPTFFPENNKLYLAVLTENEPPPRYFILNIPSEHLPRFYSVSFNGIDYLIFLDDIIKNNLHHIFKGVTIAGCYSFKITRDAELNIEDEFEGDIGERIERQIAKRDFGLATRFLYAPKMPQECINLISTKSSIQNALFVEGGLYHNLKDFSLLPISHPRLLYSKLSPLVPGSFYKSELLLQQMVQGDIIIHTPYQSYNTVLRFFNEASVDDEVEEIYVTLYRVAHDSRIVNALISAARNGKKVAVFVELKARFDEANNLKWAKKMKEAGIKIIYSISTLKVHAKIALLKMKEQAPVLYLGLLATGNLNESTAKYYTDHILLTSGQPLLEEMKMLFDFLQKREKPSKKTHLQFNHLLVAQFNLQDRFVELIDREIKNAGKGLPAGILIKLNNLEERVLIKKLYAASCAGVPVTLIVRSICCLIPGVTGMSENISVRRIVDRYLEHGRLFSFHNNGATEMYLGSADWMNRNIYSRIEVCFPIYDEGIKKELIQLLHLQIEDTSQAVTLNSDLNNVALQNEGEIKGSQYDIYTYLSNKQGQE